MAALPLIELQRTEKVYGTGEARVAALAGIDLTSRTASSSR